MSNKSQNNRDQKTGRTAQATPEGVPCGGASRQDQVAADTLARVAAFLKERDETLMPDEADDEERVESAKCILEAIAALSTQPVPVAAVTGAMVHAYKYAFGEYMDKFALGHITPPTPDVGFHATHYALSVAVAPAAQAVPGDMAETIALIRKRMKSGECDLRDVGQILTGRFDQDVPAAILAAAAASPVPVAVNGPEHEERT